MTWEICWKTSCWYHGVFQIRVTKLRWTQLFTLELTFSSGSFSSNSLVSYFRFQRVRLPLVCVPFSFSRPKYHHEFLFAFTCFLFGRKNPNANAFVPCFQLKIFEFRWPVGKIDAKVYGLFWITRKDTRSWKVKWTWPVDQKETLNSPLSALSNLAPPYYWLLSNYTLLRVGPTSHMLAYVVHSKWVANYCGSSHLRWRLLRWVKWNETPLISGLNCSVGSKLSAERGG